MRILLIIMSIITALFSAAPTPFCAPLPQTPIPARPQPKRGYPTITIYTVSWCPHCKALKEYLTRNEIPFINRDVEVDEAAMNELTTRYNSHGVPVIVIGNDAEVLKGFTEDALSNAIKRHRKQ